MGFLDKAKEKLNEGLEDLKSNVSDSIEDAKQKREDSKEMQRLFNTTASSPHIEMDRENGLWRLTSNKKEVYTYSDLVSYELLEDGNSITSGGFGVGRALTGAVLTGGLGLLIGFTKRKKTKNFTESLKIRITNSATKKPTTFITLIDKKTKHNSRTYKKASEQAQESLGILDMITGGRDD